MCSIFGVWAPRKDELFNPGGGVRLEFETLRRNAGDRGRDGGRVEFFEGPNGEVGMLGNWRATPTTEMQVGLLQPYEGLVHNGTIANDVELGAKPGDIDSMVLPRVLDRESLSRWTDSLHQVKGSYAIAAWTKRGTILLANNYKPIYVIKHRNAIYFSSMQRHLSHLETPFRAAQPVGPYATMELPSAASETLYSRAPDFARGRVLVVASGGLDSTVVATHYVRNGYDTTLLHVTYGSRAGVPERDAVTEIARELGCDLRIIHAPNIYEQSGSALLDPKASLADGVAGSEYAHEWVPARNLVLLSLAVAIAESEGMGIVALGNNLEEAGAYPDNEEEFYELLGRSLAYATQNGTRIRIEQPVGRLMKHEIVAKGLSLSAPLAWTWSCYDQQQDAAGIYRHCGQCGPCFMRAEAFRRVGVHDPVMPLSPEEYKALYEGLPF